MQNPDVTNSPWFLLLIAVSIALSLGYMWGRRRNKQIFFSAFNGLLAVLKPKDQQFTNIGGLSGYHANIIPHLNKYIRRVDATITLLPRQSWLFLPISKVVRRYDRLFLIFHLSPKASGALAEGHLLEEKYSRFGSAKVFSDEHLSKEDITWDGKKFLLYYEEVWVKEALERCMKRLDLPQGIRHIALVPGQDRIWVFLIPRRGTVAGILESLYPWMTDLLGGRISQALRDKDSPAGSSGGSLT